MSNFYKAGAAAMTSNKDDWETPQSLFDQLIDILPRMNAGDSRISRFGFLFDTTKQEGRGR